MTEFLTVLALALPVLAILIIFFVMVRCLTYLATRAVWDETEARHMIAGGCVVIGLTHLAAACIAAAAGVPTWIPVSLAVAGLAWMYRRLSVPLTGIVVANLAQRRITHTINVLHQMMDQADR